MRLGDWKLIEHFEDGAIEFYNLRDDIGEKNDLAQTEKEKTAELHALLVEWRNEVGAPVPTELNPEYQGA